MFWKAFNTQRQKDEFLLYFAFGLLCSIGQQVNRFRGVLILAMNE